MKTREDVWEAFADQFLDTETRTWIPRAALIALECGLSRADAYDVWRFEVTPAVSANLLDPAGEWAGWPRDWLVKQIWRSLMRPSGGNHVLYRLSVLGLHAHWKAIDACMAFIARDRELVPQLTWLAEHFFDFCANERPPAAKSTLSRVYSTFFLPTFRPLASESIVACDSRVMRALAQPAASGPYRTSAS